MVLRRAAGHGRVIEHTYTPAPTRHAYVVVETVALVRSRLGVAAVAALVNDLLSAIRVEMVDRPLHVATRVLAPTNRVSDGAGLDTTRRPGG